jgi:hypothetical protein
MLPSLQSPSHAGSPLADFSTLKMEATRSSETSVHTRSTRRHISEDGILQIIIYLTYEEYHLLGCDAVWSGRYLYL